MEFAKSLIPLFPYFFSCRYLCCLWLPDPAGSQADAVFDPGLPPKLYVCGRVLGLVPHQAGGRPGTDGTPCHTLPCTHQYF